MTERPDLLTIPEHELVDLRSRLRNTRWATSWPATRLNTEVPPAELRRLVDYWATGYDWRSHEAAFNALPSRYADLDGTPVHYLRFDGESDDALPTVLSHGWPSSVLELVELAKRLSSPSQYGGSAADAFTVIVPSLPGFALSPQRASIGGGDGSGDDAIPTNEHTHELWHSLMRNTLGFERYTAHGGDLGAGVTARLAQAHPESLVGIHVTGAASPAHVDPADITPDEQRFIDYAASWAQKEGSYAHQQQTRPLTLAYGLADSPVGLLAWLLEKYRAWSDPDGAVSTPFTDDFILTQVSLYWFTNSISTSFRPYWEQGNGLTVPIERVETPTALALFPFDIMQPPRSWVERTFNLTRYTRMPRGGHFGGHDEPDLLAGDIIEFFRDLR